MDSSEKPSGTPRPPQSLGWVPAYQTMNYDHSRVLVGVCLEADSKNLSPSTIDYLAGDPRKHK